MPIRQLLLMLILTAAPAAAQRPAPPADSTLAAISARGRVLQQYDIAAWHGGDAITALHPTAGEASASLALRNPDGSWQVVYGRLSDKKDTFYVTFRAVQVDGDSGFTASRLPKPTAMTGALRDMALAFEIAQRQFGKVNRAYNSYVLPAPAGGFWVYLLPAQVDPRTFPLGGDIRYRIVNGTIADSVRFHHAILERQTSVLPTGGTQVASFHTSFDSLPSETDVFVVLRQSPHLPELVATKSFSYEIGVDGTITWVRSGQTDVPIAQATQSMVTTPGHIPVWPVRLDTVGSAPRTMSAGYTEWRDTTTGWQLTFDRIVPINGADSGSYNGSWHTLTLADGGVLVTRGNPAAPIQLYDIEGRFVREIGRVGGGPDEFMSTPTLAVKGDTIIAFDGIQSRVMLFSLDGALIRSFHVGVRGSPIPIGVDPRGNVRVQERNGLGPGDTLSRIQWLYYTTRGVLVDSIRRPVLPEQRTWLVLDGTRAMRFQVPLSPAIADVFLPDGTLAYGVADRFQFIVTRTGHDTTRIFGRSDQQPIPVTAGFRDSTFNDVARAQPLITSVAKRSDLPTKYPLWNSATVDDHGFLWVSIGLKGRTPTSIAIFAPDGRYLGIAPLWWERIDQMSFGGDRMTYITFDKDRRPVIRVYRVDRRGMAGGG